MKIIFPSKRVEAPMLSEEQIRKLMDGRYVEGEFGLDEGDSFIVRYGGERFEAFCYRAVDPGRCRIRRKGRGSCTVRNGLRQSWNAMISIRFTLRI